MLREILPKWLYRVVEGLLLSKTPAKPTTHNKLLLVLVDRDGKDELEVHQKPDINYEKVRKAREAIRAAILRNKRKSNECT